MLTKRPPSVDSGLHHFLGLYSSGPHSEFIAEPQTRLQAVILNAYLEPFALNPDTRAHDKGKPAPAVIAYGFTVSLADQPVRSEGDGSAGCFGVQVILNKLNYKVIGAQAL